MTIELDGGITHKDESIGSVEWNILGQRYFPKAVSSATFAFETNSLPGQFVPVHIHPEQDEFILVLEGQLEVKLAGKWQTAKAGDLVRMPKGIPHGYFNKSEAPAKGLFWVSPAGKLPELFGVLHNMTDVDAIIRASAEHDVDFLPPEAND